MPRRKEHVSLQHTKTRLFFLCITKYIITKVFVNMAKTVLGKVGNIGQYEEVDTKKITWPNQKNRYEFEGLSKYVLKCPSLKMCNF